MPAPATDLGRGPETGRLLCCARRVFDDPRSPLCFPGKTYPQSTIVAENRGCVRSPNETGTRFGKQRPLTATFANGLVLHWRFHFRPPPVTPRSLLTHT